MMCVRQAMASVLQLFVLLIFFSAGLIFLAFPHSAQIRLLIENFFLNDPSAVAAVGWGILIAAFVLLIGFYGLHRGRYLRIKMGKNLTEIDAHLIRQTLEEYCKDRFSLLDIEISQGTKIGIGVSFKTVPNEELLRQIEKELASLLQNRFGYAKPFHLNVKL